MTISTGSDRRTRREDLAGKIPAECLLSFLDSFPLGICCTSMKGTILFWNRTAEQVTGFKREEVLGARCENVLKHRDATGKLICKHACPREKMVAGQVVTSPTNETGVMFGFLAGKTERRIPIAWNVVLANGKETVIFHLFEKISPHLPIQEQSSMVRASLLSFLSQLTTHSYKLSLHSKRGRGKILLELDVGESLL